MNHSVDTESEPEINPQADEADIGALKSKPAFRVDIKRGDTTASLLCSFLSSGEQDDTYSKFKKIYFCDFIGDYFELCTYIDLSSFNYYYFCF